MAISVSASGVRPIVLFPTSKVADKMNDLAKSLLEEGRKLHFEHKSGARTLADPHRIQIAFEFFGVDILRSNVRGHRADKMMDATGYAASEAPGGPRC